MFNGVHFQYSQVFCGFPFLWAFWFCLDLVVLFLPSYVVFHYSLFARHIFLNSISISWQYILTACIRVSNSFSFLAHNFMSSMNMRWLIFSCDLWSLSPPVHFLSMWLSGIITNSLVLMFLGRNVFFKCAITNGYSTSEKAFPPQNWILENP